MGRRPRPLALKRLDGTLKPARERERRAGKPPIPENADPIRMPEAVREHTDAAWCWRAVMPHLKAMRVLSSDDLLMLTALCRAYARARDADRLIVRDGMTVRVGGHTKKNRAGKIISRVPGVLRANPAVAMAHAAWVEVRKACVEFGMTPAARTRVAALEATSDPVTRRTKPRESPEELLFGAKRPRSA